MTLWCYEDSQGWGLVLHTLHRMAGGDSRLFKRESDVNAPGAVFIHLHHKREVRNKCKLLAGRLSRRANLRVWPTRREVKLFDDKGAQARELKKWMPPTVFERLPVGAQFVTRFLGSAGHVRLLESLPVVSKSRHGAASKHVRLLRTTDEANAELIQLITAGIPLRDGTTQRGYVLWQSFLAENSCDYRVLAIGPRARIMLRRHNKNGTVFASGSGRIEPITHANFTPECREVLEFANLVFAAESLTFSGLDIVRGPERWYVIETTSSWTLPPYYDCAIFGLDGEPMGGAHLLDVVRKSLMGEQKC